ncbi:MAG TPA: hypothetical protein ENK44_09535 [Caldithrix abyssi]|uniref:Spore protein YkvP/CgeB glycosyl transferase-like domain-containing protein n=1 Tax=Caldithrix abyssi TaxID=187145 RepID=A0A7V4U1J7_CALAY|nr:hypothetical protein [Caldithrix abyssi]
MVNLKTYFSYKKFAGQTLRIVYLNQSYFLQEESIRLLREMGHEIEVLNIPDTPKTMLDALLKTCLQVKPDCIISVNHFGFDYEGKIASVLADLDLPVLVWYLDDYRFIIPDASPLAQPNMLLFTIEKQDIPHLKRLGFDAAHYLPTGSPLPPGKKYDTGAYAYLNRAVSFIGGTFEDTRLRWRKDGYEALFKTAMPAGFQPQSGRFFIDTLKTKIGSRFDSEAEFYHFAGYAAARATQSYRSELLRSVSPHPLHIFGDSHWSRFRLPAQLHPPVDSLHTAPQIFAASLINLNMSSVQLKTALNLRLYDVPLCGGFLLTDWKEDLAELFDVDREAAVYHSAEEMKEKIDYFYKYPEKRQPIIRRAAERIEREHLLIHRLKRLITIARERFNPAS